MVGDGLASICLQFPVRHGTNLLSKLLWAILAFAKLHPQWVNKLSSSLGNIPKVAGIIKMRRAGGPPTMYEDNMLLAM